MTGGGRLRNCLLVGNSAIRGGGIYALTITNNSGLVSACTIVSNVVSSLGGGIYISGGNDIRNCVVVSNTASGGAYYNDVGIESVAASNSLTYCCVPVVNLGVGNTTNDPRFVSSPESNYRLSYGSPCINAGTNEAWMIGALDLDARPRIHRFSSKVDMGCYEFVPKGTLLGGH